MSRIPVTGIRVQRSGKAGINSEYLCLAGACGTQPTTSNTPASGGIVSRSIHGALQNRPSCHSQSGEYYQLTPVYRLASRECARSYHAVMRKLYVWKTKVGPFYIAQIGDRFHPVFEDESLGSYHSPASAADDLAGGHTFSVGRGIDTAELGIPYDIREWERYQGE